MCFLDIVRKIIKINKFCINDQKLFSTTLVLRVPFDQIYILSIDLNLKPFESSLFYHKKNNLNLKISKNGLAASADVC